MKMLRAPRAALRSASLPDHRTIGVSQCRAASSLTMITVKYSTRLTQVRSRAAARKPGTHHGHASDMLWPNRLPYETVCITPETGARPNKTAVSVFHGWSREGGAASDCSGVSRHGGAEAASAEKASHDICRGLSLQRLRHGYLAPEECRCAGFGAMRR